MRGNSVSLKGGVTRDAEVRRVGDDNAVKWGVAWTRSKKNAQGGWDDVPNYFDVECWMTDKQLAFVQDSLVKGAKCAIVDGHLEYQSWQDGHGNNRSKVVIRVDDPINGLLVTPPQGGNGGNRSATPDVQYANADYEPTSGIYQNDIPFV